MRKKNTLIILILIISSFFSIFIRINLSIPKKYSKLNHNFSEYRNFNNKLSLNPQNIGLSFDSKEYIGFDNNTKKNLPTGKDITVAVMDTGIYANHSTFTDNGTSIWSDRIIAFYDEDIKETHGNPYDIQWHGTWTASILGGNSSSYQGIAPDVNLVVMKTFVYNDGNLESSASIIEDAVDWVIENKEKYDIKIVSMSFGAEPGQDNEAEIEDLHEIVGRLVSNDILVVAAAGNFGSDDEQGSVTAPGSQKAVLCVGGVDYDGKMYSTSGRGPTYEGVIKPDVCAPALYVYGASAGVNPNLFTLSSGTSASVPFVSGLAAIMLEKKENLSSLELKSIISLTSYRTIETRIIKDNTQGWGIIQGYAAFDALKNPIKFNDNTKIEITLNETYSVYCQPITLGFNHYFFELTQLGSAEAELYIFDTVPDEYGNPILLGHSINGIMMFDNPKRAGVFSINTHDYYLVIKLIHETGSGTFLIEMVFEYRLITILALTAICVLALVYITKQNIKYFKIRG